MVIGDSPSQMMWVVILDSYDLGQPFHPTVSLVTYGIHVFDDPEAQCDSSQNR